MRTRVLLFTALLFAASHVLAQTPASPAPPAAPKAPAAAAPAPAPAAPAPPAPPARPAQPTNVRVEMSISELGAGAPLKKTVTAVVGAGYNGYVRETGVQVVDAPGPDTGRSVTPLNLDARPDILADGKIRLTCTIQYQSSVQRPEQTRRISTDIKQTLVLNLDSGKPLTISEATDPITDRRVIVEVTATVLK